MFDSMDLLFFAGGLLAGVINTMAGNGSALTVSLLLLGGMDGAVANATNRIGVVTQTLTSVSSLRKSTRKSYLFRAGKHLILPTLLGSLAGGWLGSTISAEGM
ncbi:MAG: sulfite exporter TauE/SafE family protein, partial [Flavobacteriia bacterium]|nr:sulfite exporter TauE/SafE family protein [Flavobacteriia bacterium]